MRIRFPLVALACASTLYPQPVHSQELQEQAPAPIEHRRLTIIVDGAEPAHRPAGEETAPAAAAPTISSQALDPLPGAAAPLVQAPVAVAQTPVADPPPADWAADALAVRLAPGEGFRIQVGAFSDADRAEAQIAALETTAAGPGADPIRLVVPAGNVFRAQMSGFADRTAADGACARIAATGQACFVVEPAT